MDNEQNKLNPLKKSSWQTKRSWNIAFGVILILLGLNYFRDPILSDPYHWKAIVNVALGAVILLVNIYFDK